MICRVAAVLGSPSDDELDWLPKSSDAYKFVRRACPQASSVPLRKLYPKYSEACLDLATQMLAWHPGRRPSAQDAQDHAFLRSLAPKEPPTAPETFDWTFDKFRASVPAVQERLYKECARYHPEILDRDAHLLAPRSRAAVTPPSSSRSTRSSAGTSVGTDAGRFLSVASTHRTSESARVTPPVQLQSSSRPTSRCSSSTRSRSGSLQGEAPAAFSAAGPGHYLHRTLYQPLQRAAPVSRVAAN